MKQKLQKHLITAAALSACLLIAAPASAEAAVPVTLPTFDVTLNGTTIENEYRQYPLLVYKDITYVPMTYHDCRFLGLETTYNQKDGLGIIKSGLSGAYYEDAVAKKNSKRATAQVVTGKVAVNGKQINNASEKYPLLLYRDVTYFPLTWRYAVNEFGWKYHFDNKNGLVISSTNQKTDSVTLKDGDNRDGIGMSYTVNSKYVYYQGQKGEIYRRPLNAWSDDKQRVKVAQIANDHYVNDPNYYRPVSLYTANDRVYFRYYVGGGFMGSDWLHRIMDDGTVSDNLLTMKWDSYADFGDIKVHIPVAPMYPSQKIQVIDANGTKEYGEENITYQPCGYGYDRQKNSVYVLGSDSVNENGTIEDYYLYQLDLNSGTFTKLFGEPVQSAAYGSGGFYLAQNPKYDTIDGSSVMTDRKDLYWFNLSTGKKTLIAEVDSVSANNKSGVYYKDTETDKLCMWNKHTKKTTVLHDKGKLKSITNTNDYIVALYEETTDNHSRILVFDASGKQVYTSADVADRAVINENGLLVYRLANTAQLVKVQL